MDKDDDRHGSGNEVHSESSLDDEEQSTRLDWKRILEERFRLWIEAIEGQGDVPTDSKEEIDLYSFYEELCVLRNEFRKNARRSHDTFSRFGETLAQFETTIKGLAGEIGDKKRDDEQADILSKKEIYLPLVEMLERFRRIEERLACPPKSGLFSGHRAWKEDWSNLREGFGILRTHLEELLRKGSVTAIHAAGRPFDPSLMMAVEVQETSSLEPNTVVEEVSTGYLYRGHILKLAEVRVAIRKGPQQ
jgi:molecular chaperone GrpE